MIGPSDGVGVVVVVPARDESARIRRCLASVRRSLADAVRRGVVASAAVVVVAHKCTDATAQLAELALAGTSYDVLVDEESGTVGEVRAEGVRAARELLTSTGWPRDRARTWLLNTDADSVVPLTWVSDIVGHAGSGAVAVVGMTDLAEDPPMSREARQTYRAIIAAGVHGRTHDHVYGANLAVRLDAYDLAGGFQPVEVAEDQTLVDTLASMDLPVARPVEVVVTTSGRRHGRATGGLADLLARLDETATPATTGRPRTLLISGRTRRPVPVPGTS